ncbi:MAG: ABC transporter permease [Peptococcaceae bacterium]|jgi:peptide/nickel transport system permease protein|nr:ABC transporter permease [Peptococcaceae bacterium]
MLVYTLRRLLQVLIVMFLVSLLVFTMIRMAPGSPARLMLSEYATEEDILAMEERMGLNKPIYEQFWKFLVDLFHGDMGESVVYHQPVLRIIGQRLPNTGILATGTVLLAILLALPLGIFAGANRGKVAELVCMVFALVGQSMASMWLGVLLIYIFSVKLGWLPALGTGGIEYLILPVITMGYPMSAGLTRVARSGMVDTLSEDYITATYAKGIGKFEVYTKYALRNALIPVVTMLGLTLGINLGGAVVVENIFSWTGIGQLMNQSVAQRDYAMVQATLLITSFLFSGINFLVDVINSFINPRLTLN